jgi:N-glycosylase/DNA lyase
MESLIKEYESKRVEISKRLACFKSQDLSEKNLFKELAFCILTPQTRAAAADAAIKELEHSGLLFSGNVNQISSVLAAHGIRFHRNKAKYIVAAREHSKVLREIVNSIKTPDDSKRTRAWLAENILGIGYKEASHFLRNIGHGEDLAILDRHILNELARLGLISGKPKLSKKNYLEIEEKMTKLAEKIGASTCELDMLFWSKHGSLPLEKMK